MQAECHTCKGAGYLVLPDGVKPVCSTCKGTGQVGVITIDSITEAWVRLFPGVIGYARIHDEIIVDVKTEPRNVTPKPPKQLGGKQDG